MAHRVAAAAVFALSLNSPAVEAQQQSSPMPLFPGAGPGPVEQQPLPPIAPGPEISRPPIGGPPARTTPDVSEPPPGRITMEAAAERVFCGQPAALRLAEPSASNELYERFFGIWSDASWTPQLC